MATPRRPNVHVDADGVRTTTSPGVRPGVWILVVALGVLGVALLFSVRPPFAGQGGEAVHQAAADPHREPRRGASSLARAKPQQPRPAELPPQIEGPPRVDTGDAPAIGAAGAAESAAADSEEAAADEPSGIQLFPPPGTDPLKLGIVVPEDFELPPGYLRHYQVTDDGKPLPAILMFHPDYHPVDERGEPIALPADRVVPPEMAPAGLPLHVLEAPDTHIPVVEAPSEATARDPESPPHEPESSP